MAAPSTQPSTAATPVRQRRINTFLLILLTLFFTVYTYLGCRLIGPLELSALTATIAWAGLLLPFSLILWLPLVYWKLDDPDHDHAPMLWASFGSMATLSFLLVSVALRDVMLGTAALYLWAARASEGVANHFPALVGARGTVLIALLSSLGLAAGFFGARKAPTVIEVDVPIAGLPEALRGIRIAQISDLHISSTIRKPFVEQVVRLVNKLKPDLIAMTGDFVDGTVAQLTPDFAALQGLEARLGRFYVTGNHEYYWDHKQWLAHVQSIGITALANTHAVVEHAGHKIVVAGVLDYWAKLNGGEHAADPTAAIQGAPKDAALKILLAHQPKSAIEAAPLGYDLQLSGHTHGGQFFPWTIAVKAAQPFVRGLYRVGKMQLYVNQGTGYWGPPVRLGAPSEITLLKLKPARA